MTYPNYVLDALNAVLTWDLPDEDLAEAVNDQAKLMAGSPEDSWVQCLESNYR